MTSRPVLKTAFTLVASLATFIFLSTALIIICGAIYLEVFLPRQIANPALLATTGGVILVLSGYLTRSIFLRKSRNSAADESKHSKHTRMALLFLALSTLLTFSIWIYRDYIKPDRLLGKAEMQFEIVLKGEISTESVKSTLVVLQKEIDRFRKKYNPSNTYEHITVYLYPDINSLQSDTGQMDAHGVFRVSDDGSPMIFLVAEIAKDPMKSSITTPTPSHEVSHLVIYEMLGSNGIRMLPRGIYEGIAVQDSLGGTQRFLERIFLRLELMMSSVNIADIKNFLIYGELSDTMPISQLYSASYEFVDYLKGRYGAHIFEEIFQSIIDGNHFFIGFYRSTGVDFGEIYDEWVTHYFLEQQLVE
ncbi:hypothetical protein [Dehalogenimonas sp. 4OHTPN]|uniref:Peptidase MA-like domain-containing protein n=1 Tax=Dehalogenimonas sp. 4OHTPN TaxID=3166643 RepID=A0AAU8GAP6_9CHLR